MSFRLRVTLLAAVAVAMAVAAASAVVYVVVRHQLLTEVDKSLSARGQDIAEHPGGGGYGPGIVPLGPRPGLGGSPTYAQVISSSGDGVAVKLPGLERAEKLAEGVGRPFYTQGTIGGVHIRVYAERIGDGLAVQVARSLDEVDHTLNRLGLYMLLIGLAGVGIAGGLGLVVATAALRPVESLTSVAEEVTATRDLSRRIDVHSEDELGRLASAFNEMLGALDTSVKAQRRLVADASHELRTPLASVRTNIEVLASGKELPPGEREKLLADVTDQVEELSALIGDLVEIDRERPAEVEDVRLDELVENAVGRAKIRAPKVLFRTQLQESVVRGDPAQLERAVSNLLDNAAKWSSSVDVAVTDSEVTVRDHGPGISDEDLPHVFDRFYRAANARNLPGSGLGLAIVRQVAKTHGGEATAANSADGGAVFRLKLPAAS
jgi:two-component system, OmpR family, sensor histidine kinase MprB